MIKKLSFKKSFIQAAFVILMLLPGLGLDKAWRITHLVIPSMAHW